MKILVACEFSGIVRDAFIKQGHDAWSCDILPTEAPGPHYEQDVLEVIGKGWDLMIAHPPCTFLTNAGVRWLYNPDGSDNEGRWQNMREGAEFFKRLLEADIPRIAVENPIMHRYGKEIIGVQQSQIIQPWMFGHRETKATCLWLKNLPPLEPEFKTWQELRELLNLPPGSKPDPRVHRASPGIFRWKERSRTLQGIADAIAQQWGSL